jgi:predicted enzyme related to lactoylglutathione lyase
MSERTSPYPQGVPCWVDMGSPDLQASLDFYAAVLGWSGLIGPEELGFYTNCTVRDKRVAGMMKLPDPAMPIMWTVYLAVDDADAIVAKAQAAGATVVFPVMDVMDLGRMALLSDPTGAVVGIWQAGTHHGAELVNEPGGVMWNEVMTRDSKAARAFYSEVFGYTYEDMSADGIEYHAFMVDGRPAGGVMGMDENWPDEVPAHWTVAFCVADTDAAVATVRQSGGAVLSEPADSPYGRYATCKDPHGATFSVIAGDEDFEAAAAK